MFLVKSHVPSPTTRVSEEYELDPGGDKVSAGAMMGNSGYCPAGMAEGGTDRRAGMECGFVESETFSFARD